jgi:paraquat-inducible protein A
MTADRVDISIARQYPRKARRLRLLIALSSLLLVMGLLSPIITLEKFVVIENTFSVLSGVIQLLKEGQWFLFLVISAFSIVLPVLKLGVLYLLVGSRVPDKRRLHRYLHWMHLYGKWSMLDVFVVAILVVAVKLGAIANVEMRYGLYAFAASVLITMYVTARVVILTSSDEMENGGQ